MEALDALDAPPRPDATVRASLFEQHAGWARLVALAVHRRLWVHGIDPADCIQNATVGLLEAIERFEPHRGVPFRAYATPRVRGAVFNGLRTLASTARPAPSQRIRDRVACLAEDAADGDETTFFADLVGSLGLGFLIEDAWDAPDSQDASGFAERSQLRLRLADGLRRLSVRHRDILHHHYFLHRPFSELAAEAGITKGRMSQLHREALLRLREMLAG
jgi:RNA polymerase sigma factor for flagellar operon FliA